MLVTEESFDAQYYVAHNKFYEQVSELLEYIIRDSDSDFIGYMLLSSSHCIG